MYMSSLEAFLNHPIETLERALHIRRQIDQLNKVLKELFGPTPVTLAGVQTTIPKKRGRPSKAKASVVALEGHEVGNGLAASEPKNKRKMSAAAKAKIAAAQRARWAKQKGTAGPLMAVAMEMEEPKAKKKKRKLSPESRARIVAAVKARWAKAKKAK